MGNGDAIPGIVGAGLGIVALGLTAKIAMDVVKETGKSAKRTKYKKQPTYSRARTHSENVISKII
jgi:hypothetical protein